MSTNLHTSNIHGIHASSIPQKTFLASNHAIAVGLAAWLLFGNGLYTLSGWSGLSLSSGDFVRRGLLLGCAAIYFARVCFMGFYLLQRAMGWGEAVGVSAWLYILHLSLALAGGTNHTSTGGITILGVALYLTGSYLNTASEYLRHRWKQQAAHRGRLYTGGLFRYAMHINYFGDAVLFTGFALITDRAWALLVPAVMSTLFISYHIPILDRHLKAKYGEDFDLYAARTSRFVPGFY